MTRYMSVDARAIAGLCLMWIFAAAAVNPLGDFPIVDDWAYAVSVKALLAGEGLQFSDWAAANLVSQVAWGAGFAALLGATPTAMRISTLAAALIGALALYRLFRLARVSPGLALVGTATAIFNPLYFTLSFSFMTDVPYTAMQLVAMWLLAAGALHEKRHVQALGWIAGVAALFCRQLGLFIPVGVAAEAAIRRPLRLSRVLAAACALAAFVALQWLFQHWLDVTDKAPALYGRQITGIGSTLSNPLAAALHALKFGVYCFFYLGLFALPVSLACLPALGRILPVGWRWRAAVLVTMIAVSAFLVAVATTPFPMWKDTLNLYSGIGSEATGTPVALWATMVLTALAGLGGALLLAAMATALIIWWRERSDRFDIAVFSGVVGLCLLGPVALIEMRFDRYLIPVIPCLLLALTPALGERRLGGGMVAVTAVAVVAMALVSIGGAHDYLAARRVQWRAYSELLQSAPATHVDGGWVFNGWASFGKVGDPADMEHWFEQADYAVGVYPRPGYNIIRRYPVERWLPWNQNDRPILVIRRMP